VAAANWAHDAGLEMLNGRRPSWVGLLEVSRMGIFLADDRRDMKAGDCS
jgi:hypothetical protein